VSVDACERSQTTGGDRSGFARADYRGRARSASLLDNTHGAEHKSAIASGVLPFKDDPDAIAHELWA